MTRDEWLRCPLASVMLRFLYAYPDARKRRLFAVACLRRVESALPARYLPFVEVAAAYADGTLSEADRQQAYDCVTCRYEGCDDLPDDQEPPCEYDETLTHGERRFVYGIWRALEPDALYARPDRWQRNDAAGWVAESLADAASYLPDTQTWDNAKLWQERAAQADLLRDIYGDPFAPTQLLSAGRGADAAALAQDMYDRNTFDRMPLLAQALQAAGCRDTSILAHCASAHPHVRGCWLLDRLLGKA